MSPSKMITKLTILACFIFISCSEVILSISALESFSTLRPEGSKLSKRLRQEQEVHGHDDVNGTVGLYGDGTGSIDHEKGYNEKQEIYDSGKSQRGKGAYGGANIVHRPRRGERSAASSLVAKPRFFTSTLLFYASLGLILVSPSYIMWM
ncbi:uncharacterized protein LOC133864489 isoform X2 [Alnus glutinosa]|uniref:uncharacterized protein LOC133864489 isoform X2 n=1 Tax=Alnus glutinosa TaxID=3517 RepID=UPI002D772AC1|nr:uncharacterized protein LOC133864489 isoform X2 [Alnus glutinosa]